MSRQHNLPSASDTIKTKNGPVYRIPTSIIMKTKVRGLNGYKRKSLSSKWEKYSVYKHKLSYSQKLHVLVL